MIRLSDSFPKPDADPAPGQRLRSLRLLIVDDDPLVLQVTQAVLEAMAHEVRACSGGRQALGLLEADGPWDAVLLDLMMPDLDGAETLRRLRQTHPQLPVLVVSGYADELLEARLQGPGPTGLLAKPCSSQDLEEALARLLKGAA